MDVSKAIKDYVTKMINADGMKVMLLDEDTTAIVSLVYAQSEILQKEVYLLERINNTAREVMTHLKAIVFVRPTKSSIDALVAELKRPKYGSYDIYFSNMIKPAQLEKLAEADEHEVVQEVQEYFADYLAQGPNLVTFGITGCVDPSNARKWNGVQKLARTCDGLMALMLALKRAPIIRHQASSDLCATLARNLQGVIDKERGDLFDFRQTDAPVLLIVDRRDDPVTPCLNQWTYQAMVHELIGINRNRVSLEDAPGISKDLEQVVLSERQDTFYRDNMYKNFGEIGENIKALVNQFQEKQKQSAKMDSIADMKAFVESYPEFRAMSGSVSKHVSVSSEINRLLDMWGVFDLSEIEQELSATSNHKDTVERVFELFSNPKLRDIDRVRLVMIYALRYATHKESALSDLIGELTRAGVAPELRELVMKAQEYAGLGQAGRSSDLFEEKTGVLGKFKKMRGGVAGMDNVFTMHKPLLVRLLEDVKKNSLKEAYYPFTEKPVAGPPADLFVFFVGGCTYAESRVVKEFNLANPGMRVVLGGTAVHNFDSFQAEMYADGRPGLVKSLIGGGGAGTK